MRVLIVGYGSIGKRHANILSKNKNISDLKIFSKRKIKDFTIINKKKEIKKYNPHYVIIANETHLHFKELIYFEKNFKNISILVEKPLFNRFIDYKVKNNKVFVGYNLRFHPFIGLIKKLVLKKKIWNVNVISGSYLPDWRKGRKYQKSYSAQKKSGGVLLDLSHELDYIKWIFGNFKPVYFNYSKVSNLKINSYDNLSLIADGKNKVNIQLYLNYFFKKPMRQILIDGKDLSINADLISNIMYVYKKNNFKKYLLNNFDVNIMYKNQHKEIINNKIKDICIYKEGIETMKIINNISNKSI